MAREKSRPKSPAEAAAKAVGHRIRLQALMIFNERVASPREVSDELGVDLPSLVHHINVLIRSGCIELVKTQPRGGAIEHFYRSISLPEVSSEEWQLMTDGCKQELATGCVRNLFGEALASIQTGEMARDPNAYGWWKVMDLDEIGRKEAEEEQAAHIAKLQKMMLKQERGWGGSVVRGTRLQPCSLYLALPNPT